MPRLRRSSCAAPGISRRRRGRAFEYRGPDGEPIEDPEALERIAELRIPPAWRDVWICMDPYGHLQATGIDAAGRKQYLYHERWRAHRDRLKFDAMIAFGTALPRVRRTIRRDMAGEELSRTQVLACAVRMLDLGFFRIGSEDYAEQNDSYGLATMLKRHVSFEDGAVIFDYPAKSGQRRVQAIADPQIRELLAALKRRRGGGPQLLAYREDGGWQPLRSEEINEYLKRIAGEDFSAKDFRTWNATVLAAVALAAAEPARSVRASERQVSAAVKTVAAYLGNTPAVCRSSYIDPRVIDRYREGVTIARTLGPLRRAPDLARERTRARVERAVLELLDPP
jgi:DNA topoisomerase IB